MGSKRVLGKEDITEEAGRAPLVEGSPRRSGTRRSATGMSVPRSTVKAEGLWPGGSQLIGSSVNGHLIGSSNK